MPDAPIRTTHEAQGVPMPNQAVICLDCSAPYGSDGWVDVVVPDQVWNAIAPEGGVLCFRCMTKRIEAKGFDKVPVIVASGPYVDANEEWRLIGWQHGYEVGLAEVSEGMIANAEVESDHA